MIRRWFQPLRLPDLKEPTVLCHICHHWMWLSESTIDLDKTGIYYCPTHAKEAMDLDTD